MAQGIFQKLAGREGAVNIPALGVLVGQMQHWTLTRRGDGDPKEGLYDLRAEFSVINQALFNHPHYAKKLTVTVRLNPKHSYRIEQNDGGRTVLEGKTLTMEEVRLCQ